MGKHFIFLCILNWAWCYIPLILAPRRQRQAELCEFKASQGYTVSSRSARAAHNEILSSKEKKEMPGTFSFSRYILMFTNPAYEISEGINMPILLVFNTTISEHNVFLPVYFIFNGLYFYPRKRGPISFKIWISASKDIKRYSQVLSVTICYKAGTSKLLLC